MECILIENKNRVTYITFNRPDKMNSFSDQLWQELSDTLDDLKFDEKTRAIVIKGSGKCFSSGWDISYRTPPLHPLVDLADWRWRADQINTVMWKVWNFPKPIIAQVHGYCLAGACDLAMVCDLTYAAEKSTFGEPEVMFNSHPPYEIMPWVVGMKKAKELLLVGEYIDGKEAEKIGMINKCLPDDELEAEVVRVAERLAMMPTVAIKMNKLSINRAFECAGYKNAIDVGGEGFAMTLSYLTPEKKKFNYLKEHKGIKAAFKWRDAYYSGDPEATLDYPGMEEDK